MRFLSLFAGLLIFIPTHHASAEPVPEFTKGRAAKTKKKKARKIQAHQTTGHAAKAWGDRVQSGELPIPTMKAVKTASTRHRTAFQNNDHRWCAVPTKTIGAEKLLSKNNDGDCYSQTEENEASMLRQSSAR